MKPDLKRHRKTYLSITEWEKNQPHHFRGSALDAQAWATSWVDTIEYTIRNGLHPVYESAEEWFYDLWPDLPWYTEQRGRHVGMAQVAPLVVQDPRWQALVVAMWEIHGVELEDPTQVCEV